jgi:hypothetical protein
VLLNPLGAESVMHALAEGDRELMYFDVVLILMIINAFVAEEFLDWFDFGIFFLNIMSHGRINIAINVIVEHFHDVFTFHGPTSRSSAS